MRTRPTEDYKAEMKVADLGWPKPNGTFESKALAKRTRESTQVLDLRSTCVSFGHPIASTCIDLRRLAWTLVNLKFERK